MLHETSILKKNFYKKFLGFLIKKGQKTKAQKVLNAVFFQLFQQTGQSMLSLLFTIFLRLNVFIEAKKIQRRKRVHIVPFGIKLKRRSYLAIKWIMKAVDENKKKISLAEKIVEEVLLIVKKNPASKAVNYRKDNNLLVVGNRANSHFRW